jgi:hypothetical protein
MASVTRAQPFLPVRLGFPIFDFGQLRLRRDAPKPAWWHDIRDINFT